MNSKRGPPKSSRPTLQNLNPIFRKRDKSEDNSVLTATLWRQARKSGSLNLAGRGLAYVPEKVYQLNAADKDTDVTLDMLVAKEEDAWWNQKPITNLDLSSNSLIELSSKIANLSSLTTLTLHDNALTFIPKEIGKLEKLQRVNLSRNRLESLPSEFFTLLNLKYLNISHNSFAELDPDISDLHMLEVLDASNNNLQSLPNGIGFLVRLKELILSHNHVTELPNDFVDLKSLKKLDLMHNDLKCLPENFGRLYKLICLYIHHNDITELPDFDGCDDLQELYASNNFLEKIPKKLCSYLPHLKIFDLKDNKITEIPKDISYLKNLTRLDISNNSITNLPTSLAQLAHLTSLQVEGNPIKSIRHDILARGTQQILKVLRDRTKDDSTNVTPSNSDVSLQQQKSFVMLVSDGLNSPRMPGGGDGVAQNVDGFPDKYKMRKTRCLTVTMKQLTDVPDDVFEAAEQASVSMVDFSKNSLQALPPGLRHMNTCANELIFANNRIDKIDPFISQFSRLTLLNLACNQLTDLPKEFGCLNTLRELNIANNRFEFIPNCVYELEVLEILLACNNRIKHIDATPVGLGALKRLATLDLSNNSIEHVPPILGSLTNICNLELNGNSFRQPRHQILQKGTDAVMSYLRDRIPDSH